MQKPYPPYLWPKRLKKHAFWGRTYLDSLYKGAASPLPGKGRSFKVQSVFSRDDIGVKGKTSKVFSQGLLSISICSITLQSV